jgi:CubicO group peptidase (beta-lactamase class C family)
MGNAIGGTAFQRPLVERGESLFEKKPGFAYIIGWSGGAGEPLATHSQQTSEAMGVSDQFSRSRIGSVTKLFVAATACVMERRGLIEWDRPVSEYSSVAFPAQPSVTARQLLTHTSGLPRSSAKPHAAGDAYPDERSVLAKWVLPSEFDADPGAVRSYSNLGYMALGTVLADVCEGTWSDAVRKYVLAPLALHRTGTCEAGNLPSFDRNSSGSLTRVVDEHEPEWAGGSGGLSSCAADLVAFARGVWGLIGESNHKVFAGAFDPPFGGDPRLFKSGHIPGGRAHILVPQGGAGAIEVALSRVSHRIFERRRAEPARR